MTDSRSPQSPDSFTRLTAALAGRSRLERRLGAGGMATVYLAEYVDHHRQARTLRRRQSPEAQALAG